MVNFSLKSWVFIKASWICCYSSKWTGLSYEWDTSGISSIRYHKASFTLASSFAFASNCYIVLRQTIWRKRKCKERVLYPFSALMQHPHWHNASILTQMQTHTQTLMLVWMRLKRCSDVTSVCVFTANVTSGFYGNKWWCSHLTLNVCVFKNGTAKITERNAKADIVCEWTFTMPLPRL